MRLRTIIAFFGGLSLGALLFTIFKTPVFHKRQVPSRNGYHVTKLVNGELVEGTQCGDSWQEAKALGCVFDVMASSWYAPECFDKESLDSMMLEPGMDFIWYSDKEHTVQFPTEIAEKGEFEVLYPLSDFHKFHCLYLWRKMHHALAYNLPLDEDILEEEHTVHCTRNLLTWPDPELNEVAVIIEVGMPFCRRISLGITPLELI